MRSGLDFGKNNHLLLDRRRNALYVYGIYDDTEDVPTEFSGFALLAMSRKSSSRLPTIFSAVTRESFDQHRRPASREKERAT
ncbi:MAG: hypothetical protein ACE5JA_02790 [bacterium]